MKQVQLRKATLSYQCKKSLLQDRTASQLDFETAEADYHIPQAEIVSLNAQIDQASVKVEDASATSNYTRITAPMDGVVISVVTKQGQTLNSSQMTPTIVVLARLDRMIVKANISEADIWKVHKGQKVWFTTLGDTQTRYDAQLEQIDYAPPSMTGDERAGNGGAMQNPDIAAVYYCGSFTVSNPDLKLRTKMTAQVHIVLGSVNNVPMIPWSALSLKQPDGRYKVVVKTKTGSIENRFITVGLTDKVRVQILQGLALGDTVVLGSSTSAAQ